MGESSILPRRLARVIAIARRRGVRARRSRDPMPWAYESLGQPGAFVALGRLDLTLGQPSRGGQVGVGQFRVGQVAPSRFARVRSA